MHTFTFDLGDVQNLFSTGADVGTKMNSACWLAGYVAQSAMPPRQPLPLAEPHPRPKLTDAEARHFLNKMGQVADLKSGASDLFTAIPWASVLAWLTEYLIHLRS